jgi:outer membrane protein assembly factor BamB
MASVEGVRARPAVRGGVLYVARVDGHLVLLDAADGTERGHLDLPRPRGDLGVAGDLVGLTSEKGALIAVRDGGVAWRLELGAVPTAGTLGAHGAFWVGTARGTVVRVDAATKTRADLRVTRSTAPVESLEATADGVLVTTADGLLLSLAADGRQRWRRGDLGDLVGTPHLAGTQVVVADRAGGVHVLAAEDGRPRALLQIGSGLRGDLVAAGRTLVALGRSGRLWSYDLDRRRLLAQADLPGHGDDGPQLLPNGAIFLPVGPSAYGLVPVPGSAR